MPTLTTRSTHTKTHYIYIEQKNTILEVGACPLYEGGLCGYPQLKTIYHYTDTKKAQATFRRYVKKFS